MRILFIGTGRIGFFRLSAEKASSLCRTFLHKNLFC
jgi:hypothetical protein